MCRMRIHLDNPKLVRYVFCWYHGRAVAVPAIIILNAHGIIYQFPRQRYCTLSRVSKFQKAVAAQSRVLAAFVRLNSDGLKCTSLNADANIQSGDCEFQIYG